jgi:ribosomal protein RSM22 (predicted rRNA methylase)
MPRNLPRPLEDAWQDVLDAVLRRRGAPLTTEVAKLTPRLVALSQAYNQGLAGDGARVKVPLEARIAFSFARDVPKGAGAVRELVGAGALRPPRGRALRIVDLGAGLGAMTWGIVRALAGEARGALEVEALLVDEDSEALAAAEAIAREAATCLGAAAPPLTVRTRTERITAGMKLPEADVVVVGQVLSELDVLMDPDERATKHAALITDLLERVVAPDGALVVVEPALRDRTRHLHAVRDRLVARGTTVFAPCLHAASCPVLATPGDWCHEDLAVDLPKWVAPLARAAGLRFQGLTFSHLVLRRDGRRLLDELDPLAAAPHVHLRVISELIRTKGKAEVFACTSEGARVRMRRLDRDAERSGEGSAATEAWAALGRGDVVTVRPRPDDAASGSPVDERGRVSATAQIDVWPIRK